MKYDHLIFQTTQSDLLSKNGQKLTIVRPITDGEIDVEVGNMYKVQLEDGTNLDVFEDEIIKILDEEAV